MHQLILLRHAKAAPETAVVTDHDRPLTATGLAAAAAIGRAMRQAGLAPDVVLVSSSRRTQETLEALESASIWDDRPNIDVLPALYVASPARILDLLRDLPETVRSALVIGHNPGLQELALQLAALAAPKPALARINDDFPTAALAEFLVATSWRRLGQGGTALQRFLVPADVR